MERLMVLLSGIERVTVASEWDGEIDVISK